MKINKFLPIFLALILLLTGTTAAKSKKKNPEIPPEERIKIAFEVSDETRFQELGTAEELKKHLIETFDKQKIFVIIETSKDEPTGEKSGNLEEVEKNSELKDAAEKHVADKKSVDLFGDSLVFDTTDITFKKDFGAELDRDFYKNLGVQYVVRCNILALGTTKKVGGDSIGIGTEIGGGGHFGFGVGFPGFFSSKKTVFGTAVNLQFAEVENNMILWQRNLIGQSVKHRKPHKGYETAADEAWQKSIIDAAEVIADHVGKYAQKRILKPKEDVKEKDKK